MTFTPICRVTRDDASAAFFDGAAAGKLLVNRCTNGHYMPPTQGMGPTIRCHTCQSEDISWVPASGKATLISWVVPHVKGLSPIGVAGIVELAEGPWMNALIDADPTDELHAGQPLTVTFKSIPDEVIPAFKPV